MQKTSPRGRLPGLANVGLHWGEIKRDSHVKVELKAVGGQWKVGNRDRVSAN